jgi:tRNA G37 N-methylase Trm5
MLRVLGAVSRVLRRTPLQRLHWLGKLNERLFGHVADSHIVEIEGFSIELDRRDVNIARRIILYGDFEGYHRQLLLEHARPGSTVLDIGANVGLHTLPLSRRVDGGQVVAFEPDPANFALLERNLERNA